jgi:hypothetical protein
MSASRELSPDWVLSSFIHSSGKSRDEIMELAWGFADEEGAPTTEHFQPHYRWQFAV